MCRLDPVLSAIVEGVSTGGLPHSTAKAVHRLACLLLAAHSLDDVSVFADPQADAKERFLIPAIGKWAISFVMSTSGPDDLRLEKLSKSCPAKPSRSSPRRRPATS